MKPRLRILLAILLALPIGFASVSPADDAPQPLFSWEFDNGTDGCKVLRDVELGASDGALHVTGAGADPHFIGPASGEAGWKRLVIRARFKGRLNSQIFWTTKAAPGTSEASSVPLAEVDRMIPSKVSMMPKDLLNTLKLEEILDLLAYIESAGDPGSDVFQD